MRKKGWRGYKCPVCEGPCDKLLAGLSRLLHFRCPTCKVVYVYVAGELAPCGDPQGHLAPIEVAR